MKESPKYRQGATFNELRTIGNIVPGQKVIVFSCGEKRKPFPTTVLQRLDMSRQPDNPIVVVDSKGVKNKNLRLGGGTAVLSSDHPDYLFWVEKLKGKKVKRRTK